MTEFGAVVSLKLCKIAVVQDSTEVRRYVNLLSDLVAWERGGLPLNHRAARCLQIVASNSTVALPRHLLRVNVTRSAIREFGRGKF